MSLTDSITQTDLIEEILSRTLAGEGLSDEGQPQAIFAAQEAFINDPARLKVALCTRRAGKSFGCGEYLFKECLKTPGVKTAYLGKTRASAENIMWSDILIVLDKKYKTNANFIKSKLRVEFPNGASIQLIGADSTEQERDKLLGAKYALLIVDEAEVFRHLDLRKLIYETIWPAMLDHQGTVCLTGMPNDMNFGLFYDVTKKGNGIDKTDKYGIKVWSFHKWSTLDNPYMKDKFLQEIAEEKLKNPGVEKTASFRQGWLGEWAVSEDALVYSFNPAKNSWNGILPSYPGGSWHYLMGFDYGYNDAHAFTIGAYHDYDPKLYIISTFRKYEIGFDEACAKIKQYWDEYPLERIIIDPANKVYVESFRARLQLPIESADKIEKMRFIDIMNSDMIGGRILFGPDTLAIQEEYSLLVKDEDGKEATAPKNDCCDSCFVAGTLIITESGEQPIESIKIGQRVWTRAGLQTVIDSGMTHNSVEVLKITTDTGRELIGTGNHPIWTPNGFVELRLLSPGCTIGEWPNQINMEFPKLYLGMVKNGEDTQKDQPEATESTTSSEIHTCIDPNGSWSTDQFHQSTTSTIKTGTQTTTTSQISNVSLEEPTSACICWNQTMRQPQESTSEKPKQQPQNGINQKLDDFGTHNTLKIYSTTENPSTICAVCAEKNTKQRDLFQMSAEITATQKRDGTQESTISNGFARSVEENSLRINTLNQDVALSHVLDVRVIGNAPVYNLTVDVKHEYFANGILVHNCLYLWRYCWHFLSQRPIEPIKIGTAEYVQQIARQMEENTIKKIKDKKYEEDFFSTDMEWT